MAPFVEPRLEPLGNTFLGTDEGVATTTNRRHSFSHIALAHLIRAAEITTASLGLLPARLLAADDQADQSQHDLGQHDVEMAETDAVQPVSFCARRRGRGRRGHEAADGSGSNGGSVDLQSAPREDLVQEFRITGDCVLERAAALAQGMRR
mmetsp:Transcript_24327/g.63905  ORF Transcript_24327/g.63905 Transcript_24327/m.63905 type:complete len:151 (-) Transcript_24327:201-653(-)